MKIIVAPDKFKGSLSGQAFCDVVAQVFTEQMPSATVLKLPLADGGDGTIEVANYYLDGKIVTHLVHNPFFNPINASYLYAEKSQTAFIEMAEASGLKLLHPNEFDVKNATTLGTGELIKDAIVKGAKTIILGIGGSATNDCGVGMASALGYRFLDENGIEIIPVGKNLSQIKSIDSTNVLTDLHKVTFKIACDVNNPLYGKNGAAHVYAEQKGATTDEIKMLDQGLQNFAHIIEHTFRINPQEIVGAGAAGGMGIAAKVFLEGELISGIELIKTLANFDENIQNSDWIITGEGKLDEQTLSGKTIAGIRASAQGENIKIAAFCGKNDLTDNELKKLGIHYVDEIMSHAKNLDDALRNSVDYLERITHNFVKLLLRSEM